MAEKGIDLIFQFYYASSKCHREINEIADLIDEDSVYFSAPCGIRWMASHLWAYMAVLKLYCGDAPRTSLMQKNEQGSKCIGYL